jgi:hypothetical protein
MTLSSPKDSSRSLAAILAIPAAQGDAVLNEFRTLGRVEEERQESEEVSAKSEDLEIRLKNTQETETRLTSILRTGTAKLSDVLDVETEITRVRGEIEGMEAEQKRLDGRVQFSAIDLNLSEDFQARPELVASQVTLRLKNAMVEGYQDALSGLFGALEIILSACPSLVVWGLILFWPIRWAWRRWRNSRTQTTLVPQG